MQNYIRKINSILLCSGLLLVYIGCGSKDGKVESSRFSLKIEPPEGVYPESDTLYIKVTPSKDADICYTTRKDENPKPCERSYVVKAKAEAGNPITIPVRPEYDQGATTGIFNLKIFAKSKDSEEIAESKIYTIILAPFITINPPEGFYQQVITVAVGCNKPCWLYYTTDGTEPSEASTKSEDGFILQVENDITLQVLAVDKTLGIKTPPERRKYYIDKNPPETSVVGIETCSCVLGCDKKIPDAVRCSNAITLSLISVDDKSPSAEVFWSVDGFEPEDKAEKYYEAGGNTYRAKDSADVPIRSHTILKFFSKDLAGNREPVRTMIILIGDRPFGYAVPPGGIFGKDKVPVDVYLYTIPQDAYITYKVDFPDGSTEQVQSCASPCKVTLTKEGRNIITFRAYKGSMFDEQRRVDFIIDLNPPRVFFEPANCFSDSGPISATIKSDEEKTKVFFRICDKEAFGCSVTDCSAYSPEILSGTAPVTNITIDIPSVIFFCGIDIAGNVSEIKKVECEVSGKYIEEFDNQDNMDRTETTLSWERGKLTLSRDSIPSEGSIDTQGTGTVDIDTYGKVAAIVDAGTGIKLIDISTPTSLGIVSQITLSNPRSAKFWNDVLIVLTNDKLLAYDISNPRAPQQIGSADLPSDLSIPQGQANVINLWGKYVILSAGNQGLVIAKINHERTQSINRISFERIGGISPSPGQGIRSSQDIDIFGNMVAIAEADGGLRLVLIERPNSPSPLTSYSDFLATQDSAVSVKFFFPYVAVGTSNGTIHIIDISNPQDARKIASLQLSTGVRINKIQQWGMYLIVADNQGVKFIDVKDPTNPSLSYDMRRGITQSLYIYGDRLLAGDGNSGLYVYKLAEPYESAYEMKELIGSGAKFVAIDGVFASAATAGEIKFWITKDIFSPEAVTEAEGSNISSYTIWGNKLIIGDGDKVKIFKFLPFGNLEFQKEITLSQIKPGSRAYEILTWGDTALIAGGNSVFMFPLSDIANLSNEKVVKIDTIQGQNFSAYDIDTAGNILYVSSRDSRVIALRILDNAFSVLLDNVVSSGVYEILPWGRYIATAQSISGLIFYDVSQIVFGRFAQVGALPFPDAIGVKPFGYFNLVLRDNSISLIDNTYIDRLREVYSANIKADYGVLFGDIAFVKDKDGKAKFVRFAKSKILFVTEGKAKSKNLTQDLKTQINDAQLIVSECETQSLNCPAVGCYVNFELSNNGGNTWIEVPPNSGFFPFGSTGTSLMWRAKFRTGEPMISPEICRITINYRFGRR